MSLNNIYRVQSILEWNVNGIKGIIQNDMKYMNGIASYFFVYFSFSRSPYVRKKRIFSWMNGIHSRRNIFLRMILHEGLGKERKVNWNELEYVSVTWFDFNEGKFLITHSWINQ